MRIAARLLVLVLVGCRGPSAAPPSPPADPTEAEKLAPEFRALVDRFNTDTGAPVITVPELQRRLAAGERFVLLDTREPFETAVSTLKGARSLPPAQVDTAALDAPADATVVTYCTAGKRSGDAAVALAKKHGRPVLNLDGGIIAWFNAGGGAAGPGGKPVQSIHAYDATWARYVRRREAAVTTR